jgi:hypothetical protein
MFEDFFGFSCVVEPKLLVSAPDTDPASAVSYKQTFLTEKM